MHAITEILDSAKFAGIGPGELLRIAREVAQDATLPGVSFLTESQRKDLARELELICPPVLA